MSLELSKPGDLIQFQRALYTHWAVLARGKYIIHVQAPDGGKKGIVPITKMELYDYLKNELFDVQFLDEDQHGVEVSKSIGCWASVNNHFDKIKKPFHIDEIIRRAESMVGKDWDYDLFKNNCEHFAHWCRYGVKVCKQSPNVTDYTDEDGNRYTYAQVGGTNVGPVDFKILSLNGSRESASGRKEFRANAELVSVGVAHLARVSVGPGGKVGSYSDDDGIGFKAEAKFVEADVGPANVKLGLGVSSGIDIKNGFKAELLGTGLVVTSERLEVRALGSSLAVKWPSKWID